MSELQVGREMDLIVERALGNHPDVVMVVIRQQGGDPHDYPIKSYSTSDADALAALDAVLSRYPGWGYELSSTDGVKHQCLFFNGEQMCRADCGLDRPTRAEAICRAIIKLAETEHA